MDEGEAGEEPTSIDGEEGSGGEASVATTVVPRVSEVDGDLDLSATRGVGPPVKEEVASSVDEDGGDTPNDVDGDDREAVEVIEGVESGVTPMRLGRYVLRVTWEQVKAVGLVSAYLFFFLLVVLRAPGGDRPYGTILGGLVVLTIGLVLFLEGLQWGLMPLGQAIGRSLPLRLREGIVLGICVLLGVGVTIAEPAIGALQTIGSLVEVERAVYLYALLNQYSLLLILAVAIGVGFAAALGVVRFYRDWKMKPLVLVTLLPTVVLSVVLHFIDDLRPLIGLAWDCGAITTGPVTVPIVLAVGIGVSSVRSSMRSDQLSSTLPDKTNIGGFGIVTLASLLPVITVQILGLLVYAFVDSHEIARHAQQNNKDDDRLDWHEQTPQHEILLSLRALIPLLVFLAILLKLVLKEPFPHVTLSSIVNDQQGTTSEIDGGVILKKRIKKRRTSLFSNFSYHDPSRSDIDTNALDVSIEMDDFTSPDDKVSESPDPYDSYDGIDIEDQEAKDFESDQFKEAEGDDNDSIKAKEHETKDTNVLDSEPSHSSSQVEAGTNLTYYFLLISLGGLILFNIGLTKGLTLLGGKAGHLIPLLFMPVPMEDHHHPTNSTVPGGGSSDMLQPQYSYGLGLFIALSFSFILGFGATYAEPALRVLGKQAEWLSNGRMKARVLIFSVCIGVGIGIMLGVIKITFHIHLIYLLVPTYFLTVLLTLVSEEEFINVAWDCGGVTTGPVTVPLVLSLGLAFGNAVDAVDGFGILTMASVGPVAAVLAVSKVVLILEKPLQMLRERIC